MASDDFKGTIGAPFQMLTKMLTFAAQQVLYLGVLVNLNSYTTNIDEYIKIENKNMIFGGIKVYILMSHYVVLSQILTIYCSTMCIVNVSIMYHNVIITTYTYLSKMTSNVKFSKIKELSSAFCLLVDCTL